VGEGRHGHPSIARPYPLLDPSGYLSRFGAAVRIEHEGTVSRTFPASPWLQFLPQPQLQPQPLQLAPMQLRLRLARILALALGFAGVSVSASAQVTPYGSGINPAGSLELTSGSLQIGTSFQLSVRNTAASNPSLGFAYLYLSSQPALGFPAGLVLPGLGLSFPGAPGELLLDVLPPNPVLTLGPTFYPGGTSSGANFSLSVPPNPALVGIDVYAQGLLVTDNQGFLLGLTNALHITLGAPIPGVTPIPGLVIIQPGTFQMGSDAAGGTPYFGSSSPTQPVHPVTISYPFWMGAMEVTQVQYQELMASNPSSFPGASRPVEQVSWFNAQAYCAALTAQEAALGNVPAGYQYRLPTEAEWEYACRAGTTTEFNVGSALFCNQARFYYSFHSNSECSGWQSGTVPVGSYPANPWGLFDMHGNVYEWCLDSFASYPAGAVTDPFVAGGPSRVFRGGSWGEFSDGCRCAFRLGYPSGLTDDNIGFRVVLAPVLVP
jgi:formylglycine-generating enzyme required for sulfatase activity